MQPIDGLTRRPASRYVWAVLALVFAGLVYGAHLGQERGLTREQDGVRPLAQSVLATLTAPDVAGPVSGAARQALTAKLQEQVFSPDPEVLAVFLWSKDGTQILSSDRTGRSVAARTPDEGALASASAGGAVTFRTAAKSTFRSYFPLRIAGRQVALGAIEIDRSSGGGLPWRQLQIGFFVFAAFSLVFFVLSLRRPLGAAAGSEKSARPPSSKRAASAGGRPAEADLKRMRDALLEERELRRQAEETYGFLERKLREVESSEAFSARGAPERNAALEESLRAAETRATNAEARAAEAEGRAADAEKRATIAESRFTETAARAEELEHRAARAEARASEDEVEIGRLRDAETETTVQIEKLHGAEAETAGQIEQLRHDLEESRERTRQGVETYAFLEGRLREAEERVATAITQGAGAESKLAEFETALQAAEGRAAQAETELGRLREAEAEVEQLRRQLLEERESGTGGLDEDALTRLTDRMEAAERRAVDADRRLRELAKLARAAELVRVPQTTQRREPATGAAAPGKPPVAWGKPAPAAAKPAAPKPAAPKPAAPKGVPDRTKPPVEDDLESPEPDLPKHAQNLRDRLTRTAMLKKLGHKDEDEA